MTTAKFQSAFQIPSPFPKASRRICDFPNRIVQVVEFKRFLFNPTGSEFSLVFSEKTF